MKASELIVQCLANEGVGYVFGIPGEENLDVVDALIESPLQFVTTRHEQGAAFMADVYGRLTGEAGVCLATLGPGATNLLTGVADANLDRAPLVALTGQAGLDRMHKESHQYVDVVSLFRPVTKWNSSLRIPEMIPEAIRKAFKVAQSEKPGATHIEIPEDIAKAEIDAVPLLVQAPHPGPAPGRANRTGRASDRSSTTAGHTGRQRGHPCASLGGTRTVRRKVEHPGGHYVYEQGRDLRCASAVPWRHRLAGAGLHQPRFGPGRHDHHRWIRPS